MSAIDELKNKSLDKLTCNELVTIISARLLPFEELPGIMSPTIALYELKRRAEEKQKDPLDSIALPTNLLISLINTAYRAGLTK